MEENTAVEVKKAPEAKPKEKVNWQRATHYAHRQNHKSAVITVFSPQGMEGDQLLSGAANAIVRSKVSNNH
jgi:hypothetical protein